MTPIVFDSNAQTYTSNGLGRLTDCISCLVTEERNGIFEVELKYPITGMHYDAIQQGNIIYVSHDEQKDKQPFIIYRVSRPINGIVTVNAHHVSYLLSNIVVAPFTATSVTDAFNSLSARSITENTFTFWTDKASSGTMTVEVPTSCRALLGGTKGSILDSFGGGEYEWDNRTVKLYAHRGTNNGVTIRYGKNLKDIVAKVDTLDLYNAVVPYWSDNQGTVVYGGIVVGSGGIGNVGTWTDENGVQIMDENANAIQFGYTVRRVVTMDLSNEFEDAPTVAELEAKALSVMNSNTPWVPKENIKIDFVALWQTEEYKSIAPLERVKLCDTVTIYYPELGVNATAKVIKVVWDALTERYGSIELGDAVSSFADVITAETDQKLEDVPNISMMEAAINHATELITGGLGGHIVYLFDADGKPTDMLVMDTEDVNTAIHVLRINVNGIGFSSNGLAGPFSSAWTLDGSFVADWITAGHMSCNRLQGGTLTLGGNNNGNGVAVVYDANGNQIGRWDKDGLSATGDLTLTKHISQFNFDYKALLSNITYYIYNSGSQTITQHNDYGFQIDKKESGVSTAQYNVVFPNSGYVNEVIQAASGWEKYVSIIDSSGNGHYLDITYGSSAGIRAASYDYGSTLATWPENYLQVLNGYLRAYGGYVSVGNEGGSNGNITINGSKVGQYKSSGNVYFRIYQYNSNGYVDLYANDNVYLTYGGNYWDIKGANQNGHIAIQGSSSERYKHDITDQIDEELDAHKLYGLQMKQFVFNDGHPLQYADMEGQTLPGFIAEDVAEIYPAAVIHDAEGNVENWDERRIIPGMLKLIQEQHDEIETLKARLAKLETIVKQLMR